MKKTEIKKCGCCRLCGGVDYSRTAEKSWLSPPHRPDWSEPICTPESREVVQGCVRRKGGMEGDPGGGGWAQGTGAADCSSKPNTNPTLCWSCMGSSLHFSSLKLSFKTPRPLPCIETKKVSSKLLMQGCEQIYMCQLKINIARIANAVQCHSLLSGHYDCHD